MKKKPVKAHEYSPHTEQVNCEPGRPHSSSALGGSRPPPAYFDSSNGDKELIINHETVTNMKSKFLRIVQILVSWDELHLALCYAR